MGVRRGHHGHAVLSQHPVSAGLPGLSTSSPSACPQLRVLGFKRPEADLILPLGSQPAPPGTVCVTPCLFSPHRVGVDADQENVVSVRCWAPLQRNLHCTLRAGFTSSPCECLSVLCFLPAAEVFSSPSERVCSQWESQLFCALVFMSLVLTQLKRRARK